MNVTYMSGAGNDFMVIDGRGMPADHSELAKKLCAITGADGFMAVDHSEIADFRLHFYNSDGSRGEMCGNGARCICKYAYDLSIVGESMSVQTDAGIVYGWRIAENEYRVQLNNPGIVDLHRRSDCAYIELGNPGIPHGVAEIIGLDFAKKEDLREFAKILRFAPEFPKGANINFYDRLDENTVRVLTYERGVEDYTLACGTGSGATGVYLWHLGQFPTDGLTVQVMGGNLSVKIEETDGNISALFLQGPAEALKVYEL